MNKIIYSLLFVAIFLIWATTTNANWYNPYPIAKAGNGSVSCSPDGQTDAVGPGPWDAGNGGTFGVQYPDGQTKVDADLGASIQCWHWDSTDPVVSATNASATWKTVNIPISATATDFGWSSLTISRFSLNVANCWAGTNYANGYADTIGAEGDHVLYLCGQDGAGNQTLWSGQYRLDKTKPILSANNTSALWRNADITPITLSASDAISGLNAPTVKYRWDDPDCPGWGTVFTNGTTITQSNNGAHTLYLCATDNAGHTETWNSADYKLDKIAPVVSADNNSTTWRNADITPIRLNVSDAWGSALNVKKYIWHLNNIGAAPSVATCLASGTNFNDNDTITPLSTQGDHTLYLCASDNAGNQSGWNGIYRLDKTNPIVSATNASTTWQPAPISVTMNGSDPIPFVWTVVSWISSRKYYWDYLNALWGGTVNFAYCMANGTTYADGYNMTMNTPGDHTLYLCASDVATNNSTLWTGIYRYDGTPPSASNLRYANTATNGWTNNTTITVTWDATDPMPGSGIKNHDVRIYESAGNAQDPISWNLINTITTPWAASTHTYVGTNGKAYKFEVLPRDNANNVPTLWTTSTDIARIDTVNPNQNNLIQTTATNLLANHLQTFNYTFNDGGAPITLVGQIEDKNNPALWLPSFSNPAFSYAQSITHDVSIVDAGWNRTFDSNSARQYRHSISEICDQAGNCWYGTKNYDYNIYANPDYNFTINANNTAFTLGSVVADGTIKTWQAQLLDGYGNAIIRAPGISRTINYDLSAITNTMYLDQYQRAGATSVYLIPPTWGETGLSFGTTQSFGAQNSTDGTYPLGVRVYTPTSNGHTAPDPASDPNAWFSFNVNLTVSDTLITSSKVWSHASPAFRYEPLYRTEITGELNDGWFIEGTEQTSSIEVIQNPLGIVGGIGWQAIELTFSGSETNKFDYYANTSSPATSPITIRTNLTATPSFGGWASPLISQLVQKPTELVTTLSNIWLGSHIRYTLDGKSIVQNSDSIGKASYFGAPTGNIWNQVGVKILWAVSSKYINNILDGQFSSGTILLSYQNRSEVRNKIKKNVSLALRNATNATVWTVVTNLNALPVGAGAVGARVDQWANGSIMYIEKAGGDVVLSTGAVSWIKTLVVRGANLWVTTDMYYVTNQSILGVVVQKDDAGNGGNLYISPSVTNIVGAYVIDGSVISYNSSELWYSTAASVLKNQLLVYGTLVSENTIGWSRASPPICPSLLWVGVCTLETAQTYDLNYLRRYYLIGTPPNPPGWANVIGHWVCVAGVCWSFDANLKQMFTSTSQDLAKYPIVIEYNPLIQRTPPLGFGNTLSE